MGPRPASAALGPALALALSAAALALAPRGAAAQTFSLGRPSLGDALRTIDRLHLAHRAREGRRELDQTVVFPEHPGQNQVAWYGFDWHHLDVPSPSGGEGGIRLYFYARERQVAERALPALRAAYLRLVDQFHYTPTRQIPFILYGSAREFQATNVFRVTESVQGVTSPRDLKMSLPYFGHHEQFRHVATHELVHQFTIQKLMDLDGDSGFDAGLDLLPLWFIEGIAEWYSLGGLDPESEVFLRDVVWNPDPSQHYEVPSFADDRYRGYIPTYKLGQARIAFIAETYGKDRIQAFLEAASTLRASGPGAAAGGEDGGGAFGVLTRRVLDEPPAQVDARWREWLRRRYFPAYVKTRQDLAHLREVRGAPAEIEAFDASPDGQLVLFRGLDRDAGRARLYLMDPRHPSGAVEVAADGSPGVESLHPVERPVLALGRSLLAFSALSGPGDVLYVQPYQYEPPRRLPPREEKPRPPGSAAAPAELSPPKLELGERRELAVRDPAGRAFLEISSPAFSPDGRELAFVGQTESGQQDVYAVPVEGGAVRQLTDDPYAERDLAWGPGGLHLASDATEHGRMNLFRVDPATGARTRLTTGPWDDGHPRPQADGSVLFSSGAAGKPDLYLLRDGATRRVTDFATGLAAPATAPRARALWATTFYRGRFRLVEVPRAAWLEEPPVEVAEAAAPAQPIPQEAFPREVARYDPSRLGNWRPEAGIIYGGGGGGSVAGRAAVLFADALRDYLFFVDLTVYGSFDFTQGIAVLQSRAGRTPWTLGGYHWVSGTLDPSDTDLAFFQREFGLIGALQFPLDRFRRVEVEATAGAVQRYCLTDFDSAFQPIECVATADPARPQTIDWEARNGGVNPQLGVAVRWGYDTLRYDPLTGPLAGRSFIAELGGQWLPGRSAVSGHFRIDAAGYLRLGEHASLSLRGAAGTSFAPDDVGENWERTFWLSSADNLRGYSPFDYAYLIGTNYYVANLELQFPLEPIVRIGLFSYLQGVLALDFGGVFDRVSTAPGASASDPATPPSALGAWDVRTLTGVLGLNALLGPIVFRLHFGHPFDIGGVQTPALRDGSSWVTNITLRYLFF